MSTKTIPLAFVALAGLLTASLTLAQPVPVPLPTPVPTPTPEAPTILSPSPVPTGLGFTAGYSSSGVTNTTFSSTSVRGSGTVATNPQLLYTAAQIAFEAGLWASSLQFARAWNSDVAPAANQYVTLRGYRYFAAYSRNATAVPPTADYFANDFAVGFNVEPLGPAVAAETDGVPRLTRAGTQKRIIGYPATLDINGNQGFFRMHQTGPTLNAFEKLTTIDNYYTVKDVTTGPGNNGGGVFDLSTGRPILCGVLISGDQTTSGAYVLNSASTRLVNNAIASVAPLVPAQPTPTPAPNPVPPPATPGAGSGASVQEMRAQLNVLNRRLAEARRNPNPQVRAVQVRRLRGAIDDLVRRITAAQLGS